MFDAETCVFHDYENWLFLSRVHRRMGRAEEARGCPAEAEQTMEQVSGPATEGFHSLDWMRRLEYELLRRAATELIESGGGE